MTPTTRLDHTARPTSFRHDGMCGRYELCHRLDCLERFGPYATLEVFPDGRVIARCHGSRFDIRGMTERAA